MVVMLTQCCCGCTLKTGTIVIGVLSTIGAGISVILGIVILALIGQSDSNQQEDVMIAIGAVMTVVSVLMLAVSICLIVGAVKAKPVLLVPWMVCTLFFLIVDTVLYIVATGYYFVYKEYSLGIGNILGVIIGVSLQTYFLLVVYSLYRELKTAATLRNA